MVDTDYDIDIRSIEPEYKHTLAGQAGRNVDDGFEVHLSRFTVELRLSWGSGNNYDAQTFDAVFTVVHERGEVRLSSIGDAHRDVESFGIEKLATAIEYAERAGIAFLEDIGPDYRLRNTGDLLEAAGAHGDDITVHAALEADDV